MMYRQYSIIRTALYVWLLQIAAMIEIDVMCLGAAELRLNFLAAISECEEHCLRAILQHEVVLGSV
jgi:hypothetical protein